MQNINQKVAEQFIELKGLIIKLNDSLEEWFRDESNYNDDPKNGHWWDTWKWNIRDIESILENLRKKDLEIWIRSDPSNAKGILSNELESIDKISLRLDKSYYSSTNYYQFCIQTYPHDKRELDGFFDFWREACIFNFELYSIMLRRLYSDYSVTCHKKRIREVFENPIPFNFDLKKIESFLFELLEQKAVNETKFILEHIRSRWAYQVDLEAQVMSKLKHPATFFMGMVNISAFKKKVEVQSEFSDVDKWFKNEINKIVNEINSQNKVELTHSGIKKEKAHRGFVSNLKKEQIDSLYRQFKEGYIAVSTRKDHFEAIFKDEPLPQDFIEIKIKKPTTKALLAFIVKKLFHNANYLDVWKKSEYIFHNAKNLQQSDSNTTPKGYKDIEEIINNL